MLHVEPTQLGRWLRASSELDYDWSAVVVERHRPVPDVGVLVDIDGALGRVAVRGGGRGRLRGALEAAGFEVVEVIHWGWEAPRAATLEEVGAAAARLPACVVRAP